MADVENALATNVVNAAMGVICATPTAGSSGTIPGALFMLEHRLGLSEDQMIRFFFTSGGLGLIFANHAGIAGATGGCRLPWKMRSQLTRLTQQWESSAQPRLPVHPGLFLALFLC